MDLPSIYTHLLSELLEEEPQCVLKKGESRLILKKVLASLSASCFPSAEVSIKNLYSLQKNLVSRCLSHVYLVGNKYTLNCAEQGNDHIRY